MSGSHHHTGSFQSSEGRSTREGVKSPEENVKYLAEFKITALLIAILDIYFFKYIISLVRYSNYANVLSNVDIFLPCLPPLSSQHHA